MNNQKGYTCLETLVILTCLILSIITFFLITIIFDFPDITNYIIGGALVLTHVFGIPFGAQLVLQLRHINQKETEDNTDEHQRKLYQTYFGYLLIFTFVAASIPVVLGLVLFFR